MRPTKPPTNEVPAPVPETVILPMAYALEIVADDDASPTNPPKYSLFAVVVVLLMGLVTYELLMLTAPDYPPYPPHSYLCL